jgi:formylglycine-generating enzyme required for sulfatase activity
MYTQKMSFTRGIENRPILISLMETPENSVYNDLSGSGMVPFTEYFDILMNQAVTIQYGITPAPKDFLTATKNGKKFFVVEVDKVVNGRRLKNTFVVNVANQKIVNIYPSIESTGLDVKPFELLQSKYDSGSNQNASQTSTVTTPASDPDLDAYQAARQANTQSAYQNYLNSYPKGRFRAEAQVFAGQLGGISPQSNTIGANQQDQTTPNSTTIETQWLIITSEPNGADVFIDEQPAGVTPYQNTLRTGSHSYRLQKPLYQNESGVVELLPGDAKKKLTLQMRPNFGSVEITTTPESGAQILLNGQETGKTSPCTLDRVPSGQHRITAILSMYSSSERAITMSAGEKLPLTMALTPGFTEVKIHTTPIADVYINGDLKGRGDWTGRLTPGVYSFEGKLAKHKPGLVQQTVMLGAPIELTLRPTPQVGHLNVITTPMDATIIIDGKEYGTSPATLKNLLIGDYTIALILAGYTRGYEHVTILDGETSTITKTMENGRQVTIGSDPTGVKLLIDGQSTGTTPYIGYLTYGVHQLQIEQSGQLSTQEIRIEETGGTTNYTLSFGPQSYTETVSGVSFKMIAIKGGTFQMGSNDGESDENPIHSVTVGDFIMGETEVTQKLWKAIMNNNPSNFKGDDLPVEQVSWNDVHDFITKLNRLTGKNYRLPTESEWEYAAGGGTTNRTKWSGTNSESNLGDCAWYDGNSGSKTHSVHTKSPNGLGLYDMSGNVWEWCSDDWHGSYQEAPSDGSSWIDSPRGSYRVIRGGSWINYAQLCRSASRFTDTPDYRNYNMGFRLVSPK